jgi:hypothetical protein
MKANPPTLVGATLLGLVILSVASCSSSSGGSSGTLYCSLSVAGTTQCYGYSNLTPTEQSGEQTACTNMNGVVASACPGGYIGCCSTETAGYAVNECFYAGSASELQSQCAGTWTGSRGSSSDAGGYDGSETSASESGTSPNGVLAIVSLTSTATQITSPASAGPSDPTSAMLVAIVTDTSGLDAIAGGQLLDSTGATYAAFGAGANKGTYTATVDWSAATQAAPLNFSPPGMTRTLTAKFFDNGGNVATASLQLGFFCNPTSTAGACDGVCTDFTASASCGGCTTTCDPTQACVEEVCQEASLTACQKHNGATTCDQVCSAMGQTCAVACPPPDIGLGSAAVAGVYDLFDTVCDNPQGGTNLLAACSSTFTGSAGSIECCCAP